MCSKILPQALISIPPVSSACSPKPGLTHFSSLPPSFSLSRTSLSGVGINRFISAVTPLAVPRVRQPFIVQADSESVAETAEALDSEEEAENAEEVTESETVEAEEEKPPRKPIVKLGDIMGILNKRAIEAAEKERPVPDIRTGDVVEIKLEVPENRRRASIYKGIVISKQNAGIHTTIRIRRIIAGIGVEIVFPLYSPNIKEIKVVGHRKVRRARLYYLRDKLPRLSTFK
ncbi:large ribosomal subunit protein bL19cz-like [Aristolochia californica]|uniref:large ribosomal subunit protein bL19cz-like n=1 Tax=Aristolochia californica TaxID=171875 RepID=UPI0035DEEF3F